MTIEEQFELIDSWKNEYTPMFRAILDIRGVMTNRIFGKGGESGSNSAGTNLSEFPYSTKEIWIDQRASPRKISGRSIGKRGKPIKSYYFPEGQGYSAFKADIDRGKLRLDNLLFQSFGNLSGNNPIIKSGENAAIVIDDSEAGKVAGLEKKYGKIFDMTDEEDALFGEILAEYITEALNG